MIQIYIGYFLDIIFGDPQWMHHPVRYIGRAINGLEKVLKKGRGEKLAGVVLLLAIMSLCFVVPYGILYLCNRIHPMLKLGVEALMIYQIFATKCLHVETKKVYDALVAGDMKEARKYISYLCSRDTDKMTEEEISRSAIETVSENIADGIIAPLLFVVLGGAPLGWLYKGVNTLDSMVGYKNEKYIDFGWASARMDDVLNYVPARLTGLLVVLATVLLGFDFKSSFRIMLRDRRNHSSPNSAYSEAPVAGALGIQLGGRTSYFGVYSEKPTMGDPINQIQRKHINDTFKIMYVTSFLGLVSFTLAKMGLLAVAL